VILACQIFSHTAAAAMKMYVAEKLMPPEAGQTALFLDTLNAMWNFVNFHSITAPLVKKAITSTNFQNQQELFAKFSHFVNSWTFVPHYGRNIPFHGGWILCQHGLNV